MKLDDSILNKLAEQIMGSGQINVARPTPSIFESKDSGPDYSNVQVPDDYVNKITGKPTKIVETKTSNKVVKEAKVNILISELSQVIQKAKGIIQELTTCGMIGTSPGVVQKSKKKIKYGYSRVNKTS